MLQWTCELSPVIIALALDPLLMQAPRGGSITHTLLEAASDNPNKWTDACRTTCGISRLRFFNLVQAHVAESVQFASVAMIMPSQSVTMQS